MARRSQKTSSEILDEDTIGDETPITIDKADWIETQVNAQYDFILDCYDRTRLEGNNILQWLFGTIVGGAGLAGWLLEKEHPFFAFGIAIGVLWAGFVSLLLLIRLNSKTVRARGNLASSFRNQLIARRSLARMKWVEATGLEKGMALNRSAADVTARSVDLARERMAMTPFYAVVGVVLSWASYFFFVEEVLPFF